MTSIIRCRPVLDRCPPVRLLLVTTCTVKVALLLGASSGIWLTLPRHIPIGLLTITRLAGAALLGLLGLEVLRAKLKLLSAIPVKLLIIRTPPVLRALHSPLTRLGLKLNSLTVLTTLRVASPFPR